MNGYPGGAGQHALPADSMPTRPSPTFARWRESAALVPLGFRDGHEGLLVTRYEEAKLVLSDPRFSQQPQRMPRSDGPVEDGRPPGPLDEAGVLASSSANILGVDGAEHLRLRRAITRRFTVRSGRTHRPRIAEIVAEELENLIGAGPVADLLAHFAEPISIRVHALVLGVPDHLVDRYTACFLHGAPRQEQHDLLRAALDHRRQHPGEDVISDLLADEDLSSAEVEGLLHMLSLSGRDTVAYMISTGVVALLESPEQYGILVDDPDLVPGAVEEIVRYCTMFLTVFPRTATEAVAIGDRTIPAGTTVSVSTVSANRDERRFAEPEVLDVRRDARGHVAFGHGPHGCIGQQVARVELDEAFRALVTRLPDLRLVSTAQHEPSPLANPVATYAARPVLVTGLDR
ncbi:Cytochrome P450 [Promicromonospora umidemergens]|uniref:Cytochrome P450 n=1 Tax=Promicromonospora umidemergens TaxID=629679 RepID=A0ABP8XJ02_9MICO|nr:cytochrome P450 [Promicromonospora umidemergens]MCP2282224.1 Cytochrome P450 [Promicromonospora umidemergens]